jgi:hypothetical protein
MPSKLCVRREKLDEKKFFDCSVFPVFVDDFDGCGCNMAN